MDEEQKLYNTALTEIERATAQAYLRVNNIEPQIYCSGCVDDCDYMRLDNPTCDAITTLADAGLIDFLGKVCK